MDKEVVKIELTAESRMTLGFSLNERMNELGYRSPLGDIDEQIRLLKLGVEFPKDWPLKGEILLSQLVVLAVKLKMQITIGDINLSPMPQQKQS
jgi:hypothetical protein